jgi:hypothetical protein
MQKCHKQKNEATEEKIIHCNLLHLVDPEVVLGAQELYRKLAHLMAQILNIVRNLNKERV